MKHKEEIEMIVKVLVEQRAAEETPHTYAAVKEALHQVRVEKWIRRKNRETKQEERLCQK